MGKLKKQEKVAYYRWEFLRRNEEYIKDFNKYFPNFEKIAPEWKKPGLKEAEEFYEKYSINFPINPKYSFWEIRDYIEKINPKDYVKEAGLKIAFKELEYIKMGESKKGRPCAAFSPVIYSYLMDSNNCVLSEDEKGRVALCNFWQEKNGKFKSKLIEGEDLEDFDVSRITVHIDISQPTHEIIKAIKNILSKWKKIYLKKHPTRVRMKEYDKYLEIYDLRKKSRREIAKEVYKNEYNRLVNCNRNSCNFMPVFQKISENLKAAEKIVEGGYKNIR